MSLFEFVVSKQKPWQSFSQWTSWPWGGDRWKPNALHRLLGVKMVPHWQGGYTFSGAVSENQQGKVMLSHFSRKDCQLQYNSCSNVSNQELSPKHKPIRGWHQSVIHWSEQEVIKNGKVCKRRFPKPVLSLSLCLKLFLDVWWAAHVYWSGWSLEEKDWSLCLFLLVVYLSYQLTFLLSGWPPFIKSNGLLLILSSSTPPSTLNWPALKPFPSPVFFSCFWAKERVPFLPTFFTPLWFLLFVFFSRLFFHHLTLIELVYLSLT